MNKNYEYKKLCPFKWFVLQNFPFLDYDFDQITNWQLFQKLGEKINNVINSQNLVGQEMEQLVSAFNNLKDYVDNYFDNLDVQEEINNKLDEMVEEGTLQEIIADYLNSKAIFGFDTVNDMKTSTNLINGSYARTLGYYSKNDGGGALYKIRTITNQDTVNNMTIIAIGSSDLIAEMIVEKEISLKQFGAKNNEDVSSILQFAINFTKEKYAIIVDDYYLLENSINIDRAVILKGLPGLYANRSLCGFNCNKNENIVYFNFNEGSVNCLFERLYLKNNGLGTCIKFSSRDESLTNYRVWKNKFDTCRFESFNIALLFYAYGNITDYDYSSEMLFLNCKFYNNGYVAEYDNTQSYNTNFISTDFECSPESSGKGFKLNAYGGINIDGASIVLRNSFLELSSNENLNPVNNFNGIVNIMNTRFETFTETVFNYTLESRQAIFQQHRLHVANTNFYTHQDGANLIDNNVRGLHAILDISFTGSYNMHVLARSQQSASEYSKIFIKTPQPKSIIVDYYTGLYRPWVIVNNTVESNCVNAGNSNNVTEFNNKLLLGYNKAGKPLTFTVNVPWYYRKFVINVNGAFIGNTGSITISNNNGFSHTFTKSASGYTTVHDEVYLPYNADGQDFTIESDNIWGNCYFE